MAVPVNHEYPTVAGTVAYVVWIVYLQLVLHSGSASQPWVPHGGCSCCLPCVACVCAAVYWNCIVGTACWPEGWLAVLVVDASAMSSSNCVNTGWLR